MWRCGPCWASSRGLIGGLALRSLNAKKAPAPAALAATAAAAGAADEMVELPLSGVMVVRLLFDLDQAALQPDTPAMLALAVKALADAPGKKLVIAGFHDPSGAWRWSRKVPTAPCCCCANPSRPSSAARQKKRAASKCG